MSHICVIHSQRLVWHSRINLVQLLCCSYVTGSGMCESPNQSKKWKLINVKAKTVHKMLIFHVHTFILGSYYKFVTCLNVQKAQTAHCCKISIDPLSECLVWAPVSLRTPSQKAQSILIGQLWKARANTAHQVSTTALPVFWGRAWGWWLCV